MPLTCIPINNSSSKFNNLGHHLSYVFSLGLPSLLLLLVPANSTGHLRQWLQLFRRNQLEFLHKIVEMFVAGVYMRLGSYANNTVKVMDVYMHKYPKQSRQDLPAEWRKGLGKRHVRCDRKDVLIVNLWLCPVHQQLYVAGSWQLSGFLKRIPVRPQILVSRTTAHRLARDLIAVVRNGPVDQINSIEKVHNWKETKVWLFCAYLRRSPLNPNPHTMYS